MSSVAINQFFELGKIFAVILQDQQASSFIPIPQISGANHTQTHGMLKLLSICKYYFAKNGQKGSLFQT
jgi:hypothetical protein